MAGGGTRKCQKSFTYYLKIGDLNISSLQQNDLQLIAGSVTNQEFVEQRLMKSEKVLRT